MTITFLANGHECQVDDIDADLALEKWRAHLNRDRFYIEKQFKIGKKWKWAGLHRVILSRVLGRPLLSGEYVDHIDGNPLNNQRSNLRLATHGQNRANSRAGRNNKLGVKGVRKAYGGKFAAQIRLGKKTLHLGTFSTIEDAHAAYVNAAVEHYGEFARGE